MIAALKNHETRLRQLEGFVVGLIQAGNAAAAEAEVTTKQEETVNVDQLELALQEGTERLGSVVPGGPEDPSAGTVCANSPDPSGPELVGVGNAASPENVERREPVLDMPVIS